MVEDGSFLWNSGIAMLECKTLVSEVERYLPDMVQVTKQEFSKIVLGE